MLVTRNTKKMTKKSITAAPKILRDELKKQSNTNLYMKCHNKREISINVNLRGIAVNHCWDNLKKNGWTSKKLSFLFFFMTKKSLVAYHISFFQYGNIVTVLRDKK